MTAHNQEDAPDSGQALLEAIAEGKTQPALICYRCYLRPLSPLLGKLYRTYRSQEEEAPDDAPGLSKDAKEALVGHNYKGNIRELRSILLRALFFRTGKMVTGDDIRRAIRDGMREQVSPASERLSEEVAGGIMTEIGAGQDFWEAVYEPYSQSRISRDVVRLVIEKSRAAAGKSMPEIAKH